MSEARCGKLVSITDHTGSEFGQRLNGSVMVTAEVLDYIPTTETPADLHVADAGRCAEISGA